MRYRSSFNRTRLELKYEKLTFEERTRLTFNRTRLELK